MNKKMKNLKLLVMVVLLSLGFLTMFKVADASFGFGRFFGGRISTTEAPEITDAEIAGYDCEVPGSTMQVSLNGGTQTSYLIPYETNSKTNTVPMMGQYILGISEFEETITCTKNVQEDGDHIPSQISIVLPSVSLFGTSRR